MKLINIGFGNMVSAGRVAAGQEGKTPAEEEQTHGER